MGDITISGKLMTTVAAIGVAVLISVGVSDVLQARVVDLDPSAERTPMPVLAAEYRPQAGYTRQQSFLGLVQAATRSDVGFEVPGAINEVLVQEGEKVAAGQPLARLDTQAVEARLRSATATVLQIEAELELAQARTLRQIPLRDSGAISAQTFDDTRLTEKALVSRLEAARATQRALEIDVEKATLRAPYAAIVGRQLRDRGAVTQPGAPVFRLIASATREAHIGVAVEQAELLIPGADYPLQWRDERVRARLRAVRPDVNTTSMTVVAIFELPEAIAAFDGETVSVSVERPVPVEGGWLPLSALLEGERGTWTVLAIRPSADGVIAVREVVEVVHVSDGQAYVRGTLLGGDQVVVDGIHRVAPGTLVSLAPVTQTVVATVAAEI